MSGGLNPPEESTSRVSFQSRLVGEPQRRITIRNVKKSYDTYNPTVRVVKKCFVNIRERENEI